MAYLKTKQHISTNFKPDTDLYQLATLTSSRFRSTPWTLYKHTKEEPTLDVLQALQHAKNSLEELRLSYVPCPHIEYRLFPETLRTLCMPVWGEHVENGEEGFFEALANMELLQDVTLIWDPEDHCSDEYTDLSWTDNIFQALKKPSNLRRFRLEGSWYISHGSLSRFIEHHSSSRCRLILIEICLVEGEWLSVLHDVVLFTRSRLEYLRATDVRLPSEPSHWDEVQETFDTYTESQWPHFTYDTNFGPHFRLIPDSIGSMEDLNNKVLTATADKSDMNKSDRV